MLQNEQLKGAWNNILSNFKKISDFSKEKRIINFLDSLDIKSLSTITCGDIINMFVESDIKDEKMKEKIIRHFFYKLKDSSPEDNEKSKITIRQIIELINETVSNDESKSNIFKDFLKSPKSSSITIVDVIEMINQTFISDDLYKGSVIQEFLKSQHSSSITRVDDAIGMIKETDIKNDDAKGGVIHEIFKSHLSSKMTCGDVINMFEKLDITDNKVKANIISDFLEPIFSIKSKNPPQLIRQSEITFRQIIELINETIFNGNDKAKLNIINAFLRSPNSSPTGVDVIEIINQTEIKSDAEKASIIQDFIKYSKSSITSDDVVKMITQVGIKDDNTKVEIIQNFIKNSKTSADITLQDVGRMAKGVLQYRPDLLIGIFDSKFSEPKANYIENLINFAKEFYQNEVQQFDYLQQYIIPIKINRNNVMDLRPFIEGLQDNDLALDLIENLFEKEVLVNEKDTLSLVKNRSKKQYAFLTKIVGKEDLNHCITQDGIDTLKATFGNDLKVGDQSITVSDLISYFDLKGEISSLSTILKPEFKKQLRDNFAPSADMLLYKPEELEKLNSMMSEEGTVFDIKSYFVENAKLCDYLKEKVGDIEEIQSSKTYKINFANFAKFEIAEEKQAGLNTLFNKLLKSNYPNEEKVKIFFSDLFGTTFSDDDGEKLAIFFQQNKKELAHCFCNENLPKENFESLFTTLRDGCFANIGTQFTSMLYGTMIKDEDAQVLYGVMSSKIIAPIGANQDITHHGQPLDNEIIKPYSLSPMALIEKLSKEEMLTPAKTSEIIQKNLRDDEKYEIMERLVEKNPNDNIEDFNQKAKKIASYLIIKNVVGEEKMTDLENKNPHLKALGDLIYDRVPEPSPSIIPIQIDVHSLDESRGRS